MYIYISIRVYKCYHYIIVSLSIYLAIWGGRGPRPRQRRDPPVALLRPVGTCLSLYDSLIKRILFHEEEEDNFILKKYLGIHYKRVQWEGGAVDWGSII